MAQAKRKLRKPEEILSEEEIKFFLELLETELTDNDKLNNNRGNQS